MLIRPISNVNKVVIPSPINIILTSKKTDTKAA